MTRICQLLTQWMQTCFADATLHDAVVMNTIKEMVQYVDGVV